MEINIAGAGAGKTTKMSDKIIFLRNQIDEENKIYCVAFTNSAVDCIRKKLCEHYVQIPESIIVSTIHSFLYKEIIKPYYHILYEKRYEKISVAKLPQDAKYRNAKIKRLDDMNVLHQTVIPEHAKWILCKKSKDTKSIKEGRMIIKNAFSKYCGAICVDEVQDIDKHMQEIIEELSRMGIPLTLMGDPKQDLKGFNCLRNLMETYEQNVRYISECYRCPQLHLQLSNHLVDENEKQKSEKEYGQLSVYFESEIDCHTLIENNKYDLMYISKKQGIYETHDYQKNNMRDNLAEELEPLLLENHPNKDIMAVKKAAYYYARKMLEKYRNTGKKSDAMALLGKYEKIDSRRYGIIINVFEDESALKQTGKIYVKSIDYIKGMEGEKCLFILTNDLAEYLFNDDTETNKTKNKLYVALTRSLNELSIYILNEVENKYTKSKIMEFFEGYI